MRHLQAGLTKPDQRRIHEAAAFACMHLAAVRRRTGEDYAQHGLEIAVTLQEATDDASLLAVAILHDLPVHAEGARLLRQAPLSEDERKLIRRLHTVRRLHIDERTNDLDTALRAFLADPRVTLLRMAHRCTDVEHLGRFGKQLRRTIARETLHMYTSIAGRLSMHAWRHRMEERCFRMLHPAIAAELELQMDSLAEADAACLRHAKRHLTAALRAARIPAAVETRRKGLYSSYRKMILKERSLHELTDRLAVRIVVRSTDDCYRALGAVHAAMHPMPGKLKDYIGAPKENGYRSIHTVVFPLPGVSEFPVEVQIRTAEMDRECEFGVPAHGSYKVRHYTLDAEDTRANLFRNLAALRMDTRNPREFAESLRTYFSADQLLVFDERGASWYLQKPATAADFACHVSGERAACLHEVHINGRTRPLDTPLKDGDTVMLRFGTHASKRAAVIQACRHAHARDMLRKLTRPAGAAASRR